MNVSKIFLYSVLTIIFVSAIAYFFIHTMANQDKTVIFETTKGKIEIQLSADKPITAGNFEKLVKQGFYDETRFHRVIENFMIQGGDPNSKNLNLRSRWGTGGPGYTIKDEILPGNRNIRGTISMANSGPNTGGSQFFINLVDNNFLDGKHPVFGKVVKGMEVIDAIASLETNGEDQPLQEVIITKAYM